jgi:hypothetical protein
MPIVTRVKPKAPDFLIRMSSEEAHWLANQMELIYRRDEHWKGDKSAAKTLYTLLDRAKTEAEYKTRNEYLTQ